ncbi:ChbG/HpnK family deacetylase [Gordonibacter sp. An230]|uniref:ChbG/HpnK family deacetylase n=1 Tax=Gordonibacter sp. An230 TaxID=1965592 RepID=UPI0013A6458D|nr:ChbG/HpnK family deacetylase [Gordonibacter sp. An230]
MEKLRPPLIHRPAGDSAPKSAERARPAAGSVLFHADDYGITLDQARAILALSDACGGRGVLGSTSAFANSPAFSDAAALAAPYVKGGALLMGLHLNLVEGAPCSDASDVPLLVNERGMFRHDFLGLARLANGPQREEARAQIERECAAQIERYLKSFPEQERNLRLDSHQHTHAIPAVLDALLAAVRSRGCALAHLRTPVEPLGPHLARRTAAPPANIAKDALLSMLWRANRDKLPDACATSLFCGVVLSGRMERADDALVESFRALAARRDQAVEVLFHPISVPRAQCLDPENEPFAAACASPGRDEEARTLRTLSPTP